jgi:hypothetical protein
MVFDLFFVWLVYVQQQDQMCKSIFLSQGKAGTIVCQCLHALHGMSGTNVNGGNYTQPTWIY